jgi:hypothetical protein
MGVREEILSAVERLDEPFSMGDVLRAMEGSSYAESTIRTHVASRMCRNARKNHGTKYEDAGRR